MSSGTSTCLRHRAWTPFNFIIENILSLIMIITMAIASSLLTTVSVRSSYDDNSIYCEPSFTINDGYFGQCH